MKPELLRKYTFLLQSSVFLSRLLDYFLFDILAYFLEFPFRISEAPEAEPPLGGRVEYDSSISMSDIVDDMRGDISSLTRKQLASVASLLTSLSSSAEAGPFEALKLE